MADARKAWMVAALKRTFLVLSKTNDVAVVEWIHTHKRLKLLASLPATHQLSAVLSEGANLILGFKNELKILSLETLNLASTVQLGGQLVGLGVPDAAENDCKVMAVNSKDGGVVYWLNGLVVTRQMALPRIANLLWDRKG